MKVLMVNGSSKVKGSTYKALVEVGNVLNQNGIDYEIINIGNLPIRDCIACGKCEGNGCIFEDGKVKEFVEKAYEADGFIFGSPVYFAHPSGRLLSFLDRAFFSAEKNHIYEPFKGKPGAAVVTLRRGGSTAAIDVINKYFTIAAMPIVSSTYWNMVYSSHNDALEKDHEGLQTMRNLGQEMSYELLKPVQVGKVEFKNRIVMAPMETRLSTPLGDTTQEMCDYYARRAKGGAAAIIVENTFVDSIASRSSLVSSGLNTDHLIAGKYRLAQAIKDNGAVAILQLSHGGLQANGAAVPGQEALAPSAVASKFVGRMPRALEIDEIEAIEDAFAEAARRAKQAGFDGVEIHGAHGYLICEFLSPYTNKRTDQYGGSLENRARFALNILKKVREKVGDDFLVGFRISGAEYVEGGLTIEDTTQYGKVFEDYIDYIHVSVGNYETMATWMISPMYRPEAAIVDLAAAMKKAVTKCKVITVNALNPETAEKSLRDNSADIVAFGRPLLADPDLPLKLMEDRSEDIRPCMRGHEGCISLFFAGCPIRCEVNAEAGREREYQIHKVQDSKTIVVVGGGMAGMEAARVADEYGHKVILIEKSDVLGGHFIEASEPKFKSGARGVLNFLKRMIEKSNVEVVMNTEATQDIIKSYNPDAVIIALGSKYLVPSLPGIEHTVTADQVLLNQDQYDGKCVVIGGGLVGSETALGLAKEGKDVTILEMLDDIVKQDEPLSQIAIKGELQASNAKVITNAKVTSIGENTVTYVQNGQEYTIEADVKVAALGLQARKDDVNNLSGIVKDTYVIGDAVRGRKLFNCTHDAWNVVRKISGEF